MNDSSVRGVGAVLSADIAVPEHERELRFYSSVLTTGETPLWREDLMNSLGQPVIGLGAASPEYSDLPLQWMPHIQVADVAVSVERARELGGRELMHGKDDDSKSLWAVLLDPDGAAFGLVPVVAGEAVSPGDDAASEENAGRPGRICGIELNVPDASTARDFYREVVGWSSRDVAMEAGDERDADYEMLGTDGTQIARLRPSGGANEALPPVWLICLPVGDLAESLRRVEDRGGGILEQTRRSDGAIARAVVQDPVGACLTLMPG